MADSLTGAMDTLHVAVTIFGDDDSTNWYSNLTDSGVTALETGFNEMLPYAEVTADVEASWLNSTIFNKFVDASYAHSWTTFKRLFAVSPYARLNVMTSVSQPFGSERLIYGTPVDTTWAPDYVMTTASVATDWRLVRHEIAHDFGLAHTHHQGTSQLDDCIADSSEHEYPHNYWPADIRDTMAWVRGDMCPDTPPDPTFNASDPYQADWAVDSCSGPDYFPWKTDSTTHYMTNLMSYGPATNLGPDSLTPQQLACVRCYLETHPVFSRWVTWVE
jgi:hypothetical protein